MKLTRLLTIIFVVVSVIACSDDDDTNVASSNTTADAGNNATSADASNNATTPDGGAEDAGEIDMAVEPGLLTVEPPLITFSDVRIGETQSAEVVLRNLGGTPVTVTRADVSELDRQGDPEFRATDNWIDGTTIIEPQTFIAIEVEYAPSDNETDRGIVEVFGEDTSDPVATIRLETINAYADLEAPGFVRFGKVESGETATRRVVLWNRGIDPLLVNAITVTDNIDRFAVEIIPTETLPAQLNRDQNYQFDLVYSPNNDQTHRGTLTIASTDPDQPTFDIALTGNSATPCLATDPSVADFGEVTAATLENLTVTLFNCGTQFSVTIDSIEVVDTGGDAFTLTDLPGFPLTIAPLQTEEFEIGVEFDDPGLRIGTVQIVSDSGNSPFDLQTRATIPEDP